MPKNGQKLSETEKETETQKTVHFSSEKFVEMCCSLSNLLRRLRDKSKILLNLDSTNSDLAAHTRKIWPFFSHRQRRLKNWP